MLKWGSMIVQLWWWKTTPPWSLLHCSPITGLNRPQKLIDSTRHLLPSGLRWFPREIDCPKRVAPEPHTIALWHLIHGFRLIVYNTKLHIQLLLYAFVLVHPLILFLKIARTVALRILVYTLSAIHYCLEHTPHHIKHTESWRSTPSGSTHINYYKVVVLSSGLRLAFVLGASSVRFASDFHVYRANGQYYYHLTT